MDSKVVVITLNYNQNQFTIDCVNSLLKSDYSNYQILLIDNGSTKENYSDLLNKLPENDEILLDRIENNRGYVGGINYGLNKISELNGDYILIMNNDTIVDSNAISELVKTSKDYRDEAIVTGKVYYYDEPNVFQDVGYEFENKQYLYVKRLGLNEIDTGQFDEVKERDMLDDVFWLFSSKVLKKNGIYSTYFWFNNEQADFALRAKKNGFKLVFTPYASILHKGSVSIGGRDYNPVLAYYSMRASLIYRFLHLSKINFLKYYFNIFWGIIKSSFKALFILFKGKNIIKYVYAKFRAFLSFNIWLITRSENNGYNPFK